MTHKHLMALAIGCTFAAIGADAANCALRDKVVERLETRYSEHLIARGLQSRHALMEIFASTDTGTYTVLITNAQGVSCVVSAGTDLILEEIKARPAGTAG